MASEDWINNPLEIVDRIYAQHGCHECHSKVVQYFTEKGASNLIPSLNDSSIHHLKPNSLVRFRCMIQDMFDPELFLQTYEVVDKCSNQRIPKCGLYKDVIECKQTEEVDIESQRNTNGDRLTYYCVSVPGENDWVKCGYSENSPKPNVSPLLSDSCRAKRPLNDDVDDIEMEETNGQKKSKQEKNVMEQGSNSTNGSANMNFPLPETKGVACLVKIYDHNIENFKLNDVIECIGILAVNVNPEISQFGSEINDMGETEGCDAELIAHNPPSSLVPRIHAIMIKTLHHNNPYLPADVDLSSESAVEFLSKARIIREDLVKLLKQVLLGDELAAQYVLFNLISSVYFRRDVLALGKLTLNLSNVPVQPEYTERVNRLLQKLTTKSYCLQLSRNNLNTIKFTPRKDYSSNRLITGILQLSPNTHLIIDETALSTGQLNSEGIQNIASLKHLITWQQMEYDFKYHKIAYPSNVAILVVSQGKSLLPSDCHIRLNAAVSYEDWNIYYSAAENHLNSLILRECQNYLTLLKFLNYSLSEDVQKMVQDDFVHMRQQNLSMTGDDLHSLLLLARYQSLSVGETSLSKESWEKVKEMESERKIRLKSCT